MHTPPARCKPQAPPLAPTRTHTHTEPLPAEAHSNRITSLMAVAASGRQPHIMHAALVQLDAPQRRPRHRCATKFQSPMRWLYSSLPHICRLTSHGTAARLPPLPCLGITVSG